MKVLILYFSGTGNTQFIAEEIYRGLINNNVNTDIASVEDFKPEDTKKFDIVLFGFPVYACDMPQFLEEYFDRISVPNMKGIYLFSTLGFYGGDSLRKVGKRLTTKGCIVLGGQEIRMPGSDGLAFVKKDSKFAAKALSRDYSKIAEIEKVVAFISSINKDVNDRDNNQDINSYGYGLKLKITTKLIDPLFYLILRPMEKIIKRKLRADSKCVRCGICEKVCPSKNIIVTEEGVKFSNKCYVCLRCVHQCPKESIQIGKMTVNKFRWKGPNGEFNPGKH